MIIQVIEFLVMSQFVDLLKIKNCISKKHSKKSKQCIWKQMYLKVKDLKDRK